MIIVETVFKDPDEYDPRDRVSISIDGKSIFSIGTGEPEDMTLNRDLNDVYSVMGLLQKMYLAGKNGDVVEFESIATTEN